jgi:hypothetical protein
MTQVQGIAAAEPVQLIDALCGGVRHRSHQRRGRGPVKRLHVDRVQ